MAREIQGATAIVWRLVSDLMPHVKNSNTHEPWQVKLIADSIVAYGFNVPVLIDDQGTIIAGHGRVMAAIDLGLESIPTITLAHLDDDQARAFLIADNQIPRGAGTDKDLLKSELIELRDLGVDLGSLGFGKFDLDKILGTVTLPDLGNGPAEPGKATPKASEPKPGEPDPRIASDNVRVLQLVLDEDDQEQFLTDVATLQDHWGMSASTITDVVQRAVRSAADTATHS